MNRTQTAIAPLLVLVVFLGVAATAGADGSVIAGITFNGLKRTRESAAQKIIRPIEIGSEYSSETDELIVQKLREAGIFNPDINVESRTVDNQVYIEIQLKDRWTLIPVPIVSYSNDGAWRAGVLTIDSNFLGFYKTLGLGFFFGSEGWTLISFFGDRSFLGTDFGFTAGLSAGLDEPEVQDVDGNTIREYQTDKLSLGFGLDFPLTNRFTLGGFWEYDQSRLRTGTSGSATVPNLYSTGIGTFLKWENLYFDIPYTRGFSATSRLLWNWGLNGSDSYPLVDGRLSWSFNPFFNHLVNISLLGGWGTLPAQKQFELGGLPGSLILPMSKILADEFVSSSLSYNLPVWSFKGGTVSMKSFYETGYYKSDLVDRTFFHGPGLGLELYIDNLALPAIGINAGWNLETGRFQFSGGVGMGGGRN